VIHEVAARQAKRRVSRLSPFQLSLNIAHHHPGLSHRCSERFRSAAEALAPIRYFVIFMDIDPGGILGSSFGFIVSHRQIASTRSTRGRCSILPTKPFPVRTRSSH